MGADPDHDSFRFAKGLAANGRRPWRRCRVRECEGGSARPGAQVAVLHRFL